MAAAVVTRVIVLLLAPALVACASARREIISPQNSENQTRNPAFCELAKPMTWAARDSVVTRNQIRSFNALVARHCTRAGGSSDGR